MVAGGLNPRPLGRVPETSTLDHSIKQPILQSSQVINWTIIKTCISYLINQTKSSKHWNVFRQIKIISISTHFISFIQILNSLYQIWTIAMVKMNHME
jgi:hypothetical protein